MFVVFRPDISDLGTSLQISQSWRKVKYHFYIAAWEMRANHLRINFTLKNPGYSAALTSISVMF